MYYHEYYVGSFVIYILKYLFSNPLIDVYSKNVCEFMFNYLKFGELVRVILKTYIKIKINHL